MHSADGLPPRLGIADTTFARYDMAAAAIDTLRREGAPPGGRVAITRVTVPGIKDLPVACLRLLEDGCDLVLALGMVGGAPVDKLRGQAASAASQQVMLATRRHVLEVLVHEDEAQDDDEAARLFDARTREHAQNALWMLFAPDSSAGVPAPGNGRASPTRARSRRSACLPATTRGASAWSRRSVPCRRCRSSGRVRPTPRPRAVPERACASKHALLAEMLDALDVPSLPLLVVGPLVPAVAAHDTELARGRALLEVHECLTVVTPWAGPVRVDVTVDPPLAARGLPATLGWEGASDMALAIDSAGPGWSVPRAQRRAAKKALRRRLYGPGERTERDAILRRLSALYAGWRAAATREDRP
jgi:riboflavin synthase